MTVKELIDILQTFPIEMEVVDMSYIDIEDVSIKTWTHSNYPYNQPDRQVVMIK